MTQQHLRFTNMYKQLENLKNGCAYLLGLFDLCEAVRWFVGESAASPALQGRCKLTRALIGQVGRQVMK